MRRAVVYERKGKLFIRTASVTTTGLWVEDGPCTIMPEAVDPETLGHTVLEHLKTSAEIPHPTDWKLVQQPMLKAAGVKSWITFATMARGVGLELTEAEITLVAWKSGKRGFVPVEAAPVQVDVESDPRALGEAVKAVIAAAE